MAESRAKVWKRIERLAQPERELLAECIQSGKPKFELPPQDGRVKNLHNVGAISCVDYDRELSVFEIQPWIWQDLQAKLPEGGPTSA
jgi:hypothetical protein